MSRHIDPKLMDATEGRELAHLAHQLGWATWVITELPWSETAGTVDETLRMIITNPRTRTSVEVFAFFHDVRHGVPGRFSWRPTFFSPDLEPTHGVFSSDMQALRNLIRDHAQIDLTEVA